MVGWGNRMMNHPLQQIRDIDERDDFNWPDPYAEGRIANVEKTAKILSEKTDYALVAAGIQGAFERSWYLRGFEEFLRDLIVNPRLACAIMDRVVEVHMGLADVLLSEVGDYIQMYESGDDLGCQTSLLFSPETYRRFVKPRQQKLLKFVKSKTDAKVFFHCCGAIRPLIPDLVEIGVDVLNPIQPRAEGMDARLLKAEFGDRVCFHGGIDIQQTLPQGSIIDVRNEVESKISTLAPGGGYILAPAHIIQPDTPPENILALYETARKLGRYATAP